jgi:NADH-quinone oxidoreductase subunit N
MNVSDLHIVLPEIVLAISACAILLLDLGVRSPTRRLTYGLSLLLLLGLASWYALRLDSPQISYAFSGMVQNDMLGNVLKLFACLATTIIFIYVRTYACERGMLQRGGELYVLMLFALLGICIIASSHNLLVIYLGLELLTLCSYVLVALRRDEYLATEAAVKYFILGAMASGFLLYGMSIFYGATGTLVLQDIAQHISLHQVDQKILTLGLVFIVAGLAFKFGAAPFHLWVPDVYQGAPTAIALMLGSAPKFAAFAMAIRLLVEGLPSLAPDWQQMLGVLAVASLLVGNLAAIAQTNMKRMLAYSAIGQMGFVFLGLLSGSLVKETTLSLQAYSASLFYIITYVLTSLVTFGVILLLARKGFESDLITDFSGLNQRSPFFAAIMAIAMFSLAGLPTLVGFYAKLVVLEALLDTNSIVHLAMAVFAVLMSLVAAFYYLRVVKLMYFDPPPHHTPIVTGWEVKTVLGTNGLLILILGILPSGLMALCTQAIYHSIG